MTHQNVTTDPAKAYAAHLRGYRRRRNPITRIRLAVARRLAITTVVLDEREES